MIYTKTKLEYGVEVKVLLYGDELFTICPDCGVEQEVSFADLADVFASGGDFSTSIVCAKCTIAKYKSCCTPLCNEHGALVLDDGRGICENCAQIQSELAP